MTRVRGKIITADYGFNEGKHAIKVKMELTLDKEQYLGLISKTKKNNVLLEVLADD